MQNPKPIKVVEPAASTCLVWKSGWKIGSTDQHIFSPTVGLLKSLEVSSENLPCELFPSPSPIVPKTSKNSVELSCKSSSPLAYGKNMEEWQAAKPFFDNMVEIVLSCPNELAASCWCLSRWWKRNTRVAGYAN